MAKPAEEENGQTQKKGGKVRVLGEMKAQGFVKFLFFQLFYRVEERLKIIFVIAMVDNDWQKIQSIVKLLP